MILSNKCTVEFLSAFVSKTAVNRLNFVILNVFTQYHDSLETSLFSCSTTTRMFKETVWIKHISQSIQLYVTLSTPCFKLKGSTFATSSSCKNPLEAQCSGEHTHQGLTTCWALFLVPCSKLSIVSVKEGGKTRR